MIFRPGRVLCAGNLTEDILAWPVDQVVFNTTVWVEDIITSFGGNGANTSYAIARLGGSVRLIGLVGRDEAGTSVLRQLEHSGVELRVDRCDLPTPVTVVIVRSDGARSFLHRPGASRNAFADPPEFAGELVEGCSHFHLANPFAMPNMRAHAGSMVPAARQAGLTTSLDTGWDATGQWLEVLGPCLSHLDLLFVNEDEAEELSGDRDPARAADFFRSRGVGSVVVKLGARGCAWFGAHGELYMPAFAVEPVDSTGAGDCFAGAFLAGLQAAMTVEESLRLACAAGALSVAQAGATAGLLGLRETLDWMQARTP